MNAFFFNIYIYNACFVFIFFTLVYLCLFELDKDICLYWIG